MRRGRHLPTNQSARAGEVEVGPLEDFLPDAEGGLAQVGDVVAGARRPDDATHELFVPLHNGATYRGDLLHHVPQTALGLVVGRLAVGASLGLSLHPLAGGYQRSLRVLAPACRHRANRQHAGTRIVCALCLPLVYACVRRNGHLRETHTRTHTYTHKRARAHTHTHTHTLREASNHTQEDRQAWKRMSHIRLIGL